MKYQLFFVAVVIMNVMLTRTAESYAISFPSVPDPNHFSCQFPTLKIRQGLPADDINPNYKKYGHFSVIRSESTHKQWQCILGKWVCSNRYISSLSVSYCSHNAS